MPEVHAPQPIAGHSGDSATGLARSLTLTHAVLYGLGVTIGAGIYVLVGVAAGRAGHAAPIAFLVAAALMAFTAASFAELGGRMPVAAGEAAYVRAGFGSPGLATAAGLLVAAIAIVSAAAISVGSAGYVGAVLNLPRVVLIAGIVLAMGLVASIGIKESVTFAGIMTVIEVGGLLMLVVFGVGAPAVAASVAPGVVEIGIAGIASATLLAVFAFIGFEGLANVAEEMENPKRDLPRAIFLTLVITTLLYMAVVGVALRAASPAELAGSSAPLTLVFQRLVGADPRIMTLIAIVATINGIIVQIIMAARVLYGLARQDSLPGWLASVDASTRTPLMATALVVGIVLLLALLLPLERLADWTARLTLVLFALVNGALIRIKRAESSPPAGVFVVPAWVPWAGLATIVAVLLVDAVSAK